MPLSDLDEATRQRYVSAPLGSSEGGLLRDVGPRYHFAGSANVYFELPPYRNARFRGVTRFVGLGRVGNVNKVKSLKAFNVAIPGKLPTTEEVAAAKALHDAATQNPYLFPGAADIRRAVKAAARAARGKKSLSAGSAEQEQEQDDECSVAAGSAARAKAKDEEDGGDGGGGGATAAAKKDAVAAAAAAAAASSSSSSSSSSSEGNPLTTDGGPLLLDPAHHEWEDSGDWKCDLHSPGFYLYSFRNDEPMKRIINRKKTENIVKQTLAMASSC